MFENKLMIGDVGTGKFLGWYFPEENKVPFFKKHRCSYCYYSSDRPFDLKKHQTRKHSDLISMDGEV